MVTLEVGHPYVYYMESETTKNEKIGLKKLLVYIGSVSEHGHLFFSTEFYLTTITVNIFDKLYLPNEIETKYINDLFSNKLNLPVPISENVCDKIKELSDKKINPFNKFVECLDYLNLGNQISDGIFNYLEEHYGYLREDNLIVDAIVKYKGKNHIFLLNLLLEDFNTTNYFNELEIQNKYDSERICNIATFVYKYLDKDLVSPELFRRMYNDFKLVVYINSTMSYELGSLEYVSNFRLSKLLFLTNKLLPFLYEEHPTIMSELSNTDKNYSKSSYFECFLLINDNLFEELKQLNTDELSLTLDYLRYLYRLNIMDYELNSISDVIDLYNIKISMEGKTIGNHFSIP